MGILSVLDSVNDENDVLTEEEVSTGEAAKEVASALTDYFKDNQIGDSKKTELAQKIIDIIPPELIDDTIETFKQKLGNEKINPRVRAEFDKKKIETNKFDTYGDLIDDKLNDPEFNKKGKPFILTIMAIISIIEPTPVGEIVTAVLAMLPGDKFMKILFTISFPITSIVYWFRKKHRIETAAEEETNER